MLTVDSPTPRRATGLLVACAAPTLLYVGMLLFYPERDLLILWPRDFGVAISAVAVMCGVTLAYGALAWLLLRRFGASPTSVQKRALAALVIVGGLAIQLAVVSATHADPLQEIARRTYAWKTGGYWTVGAPVTDLRDFVGKYAERAPTYPVHQKRHPPGLTLIFWAGARLFETIPGVAAAWADWLSPNSCQSLLPVDTPAAVMAAGGFGALVEIVLAMAPIAPLYALVKRLSGARAAAHAAALYAMTPGFGQWVSQFDRGLALATIVTLYFCERMAAERRPLFALAAGVTLSVATFMTFGAAPIGLIAAVYAAVRLWQLAPAGDAASRARMVLAQWPFVAQCCALTLAGLASVWAFAYATTGLNPAALYTVVFDSHLSLEFPFWPFVAWHPWDLLTMIGLPIAAITLVAGWRNAGALAAAFVIPLAALSLAHVARGETGRVWLYFTPLAVGAAGIVLSNMSSRAGAAVLGLLGLHLVTQGALIRTHEYGYWPETLPAATAPADATPVDTRFGASGQIALLAYRMEPLRPGAEGALTLYWQRMSDEPIRQAYKAFVHVAVDESDQGRVAQHDEMPVYELYPTTCWQKGQVVADVHRLPVAGDARPGDYPVFVGLYDPVAGTRPPTFASEPARQMHGSVLLPTKAVVR